MVAQNEALRCFTDVVDDDHFDDTLPYTSYPDTYTEERKTPDAVCYAAQNEDGELVERGCKDDPTGWYREILGDCYFKVRTAIFYSP